MKIGQVAVLLAVPVPTLRRWTHEFPGGLSPHARTGDGAIRVFTESDVAFLHKVKNLLKTGHSYASAREVLQDSDERSASEQPAQANVVHADGGEPSMTATAVRQIVADMLRTTNNRVLSLEADVRELKKQLEQAQHPHPTNGQPYRSIPPERFPRRS